MNCWLNGLKVKKTKRRKSGRKRRRRFCKRICEKCHNTVVLTVVDQEGYLPYPGSFAWRCRSNLQVQPRVWWSYRSKSWRRSALYLRPVWTTKESVNANNSRSEMPDKKTRKTIFVQNPGGRRLFAKRCRRISELGLLNHCCNPQQEWTVKHLWSWTHQCLLHTKVLLAAGTRRRFLLHLMVSTLFDPLVDTLEWKETFLHYWVSETAKFHLWCC